MTRLGHEHAAGGKLPWKIRNHQKRDVQGSCDLSRMKRTRATKTHHDEIARIVAAFDRHLTHRQRHVHHRNLDDGARGLGFRESERARNRSVDGFAGRLDVELHLTAKKLIRIEAPQQEIGVGNRGLGSAFAIAGGTRIRSGTHRPDLERSRVIHFRDAATAGTDFNRVDHGKHHRQA